LIFSRQRTAPGEQKSKTEDGLDAVWPLSFKNLLSIAIRLLDFSLHFYSTLFKEKYFLFTL